MKKLALILLLLVPLPLHSALVNGKVHDGTPIQCDLPGEYHKQNIAVKGLGCCVFQSISHSAYHQQIPALYDMPQWMKQKNIAGGGWPEKVDKLIPQICKDRGYPVPDYIQVEGSWKKVRDVLTLATLTNRMVCITYSRSPTKRYGGQKIAHMVNIVSCNAGGKWWVFLDNNYVKPSENAYEWCTESEAQWASEEKGMVWAIVFLDYGPPPTPHFKEEYE